MRLGACGEVGVGVTVAKTAKCVNGRLSDCLARGNKRQIVPLKESVFHRNVSKLLVRALTRYSMIVGLTNTPVGGH